MGWVIVVAVAGAYALAVGGWGPTAMQDLPNHLARAAAIDDIVLHGGHAAGAPFEFHFMAVPYVMHDLLFAGCVELFGADAAGMIWSAFVMLALPCALVVYARIKGLRGIDLPVLFLVGLYLATHTAFWKGFLAYCLALAIILLTLAAADLWRRRASGTCYAAYIALLVFGYLTHLTATLFAGAALALTAALRLWRRQFSIGRELALLLPLAMLGLWHLIGHSVPVIAQQGTPLWRSPFEKLRFTAWSFVRFDRNVDIPLLCLTVACLAVVAVMARRSDAVERSAYRGEMLLLAALFAAVYVVLPHSIGPLSWLDMRAMPMLAAFLVLACFAPRTATGEGSDDSAQGSAGHLARHWPLVLASLLALSNLVELGLQARQDRPWLVAYRQIAATLPRGAWLLPVYTDTRKGAVRSMMHAGEYALIDAGAPNPYMFSRNLGDAMVYFSYRTLPYAPEQSWYVEPAVEQPVVDWRSIASSYRYLLVSKPFDPSRIPLDTSLVSENSAAALLMITAAR